jgi:hypothetical protein
MAWPLIVVGAALMATSAAGQATEEGGDMLKKPYPEPSDQEKIASKQMLDLAQSLYEKSAGSDPEFYKRVFEGLPATKMSDADKSRLAKSYDEISATVNKNAIMTAGQAFGEDMDSLVARGAMSPVQADAQKMKNDARVKAMMSILDKRWQATQSADARSMWLGQQKVNAQGVGLLENVRSKNQSMLNQVIDTGLKHALSVAGQEQQYQTAQMNANEKVLMEKRAADYNFWGNFFLPGKMGSMGSQSTSTQNQNMTGINTYQNTNTAYQNNSYGGSVGGEYYDY